MTDVPASGQFQPSDGLTPLTPKERRLLARAAWDGWLTQEGNLAKMAKAANALEEAAEKMTNKESQQYGLVMRAAGKLRSDMESLHQRFMEFDDKCERLEQGTATDRVEEVKRIVLDDERSDE